MDSDKLNRPGQLIVANHPTLIDIVFLISRIPYACCIVKDSLWHNPLCVDRLSMPVTSAMAIRKR
ncbi:hypothetical protein [methane-oxidizing endosymbiont of Gigantopelta aegis]|uniref:hypothetical protein n=1 Tax=methane-oxidizing endosymbiont of Gigantopelta aegis TaxID=2794938 RepID=UPI001FDA576A|nr:hypothetical protein [methane-oxidizing endosymbiont of Gigantopelta aegis]